MLTPAAVVQAQLDAYNAKDVDALMATYAPDAPDARQFVLHGALLAEGQEAIRPRYVARFLEPDLRARLVSRSVVGSFVTDVEIITRNFPEGLGTVEMLCVYEVVDGRIRTASFATGATTLTRS